MIDSNLKRAEKLLMNFSRRMATDKIIQGFAVVNICVLLGLILYVAISGKSLSAATSSNPYSAPDLSSTTPTPSAFPTY